MTDTTFALTDVERLAATLDDRCRDLDDQDQALLHAIFAKAGEGFGAAADGADEVSGFSFSWGALLPAVQKPLPDPAANVGLYNSFQGGLTQLNRAALNPQPLPP